MINHKQYKLLLYLNSGSSSCKRMSIIFDRNKATRGKANPLTAADSNPNTNQPLSG